MHFESPLVPARLERRYKRFLADVTLTDGTALTVHCPNTGSMMGVAPPGCRVWLLLHASPTRNYAYSWELTELADGTLVGVNTHRSNALVAEAVKAGRFPVLAGYDAIIREQKYGTEASRIDLLLRGSGRPDCYVEVKNVTAAVTDGIALFPDAVSERGTKHLREMIGIVATGARAVLVFCVQRPDVTEVRPADVIDPVYGRTLRDAIAHGVEVVAWRADLSTEGSTLTTTLPVVCP